MRNKICSVIDFLIVRLCNNTFQMQKLLASNGINKLSWA